MNALVRRLRQERKKLIEDARGLDEKAREEERSMTSEEEANFERMMKDAQARGREIERQEQIDAAERDLAAGEERQADPSEPSDDVPADAEPRSEDAEQRERVSGAVDAFLRGGIGGMSAEQRSLAEERGMLAASDSGGGYLRPPMEFRRRLIKKVDDLVHIRQHATVETVTEAESLGFPTLEKDVDDFDWTTELKIPKEDEGLEFGLREWKPHPLAKLIRISKKLLRVATMDTQGLALQRMGYKLGVTKELAYLFGDGNGKPLGCLVKSDQGISGARDFHQGNTDTDVEFDGLVRAHRALKPQYRRRARWLANPEFFLRVALKKDKEDRYIWRVSVREGEPDRLLNSPIMESEHFPKNFAAGQYVAIVADWQWYYIATALTQRIEFLKELFALSKQIGLIVEEDEDGMPALEEAFSRVQLAP